MEGVEKRVRVIAGMPTTMNSTTARMPPIIASHGTGRPWKSSSEPAANTTEPMTVQARGTPVCTSTANATMDARMSAMATGRTGSTPSP